MPGHFFDSSKIFGKLNCDFRRSTGAPSDFILQNYCSKEQILPGHFFDSSKIFGKLNCDFRRLCPSHYQDITIVVVKMSPKTFGVKTKCPLKFSNAEQDYFMSSFDRTHKGS